MSSRWAFVDKAGDVKLITRQRPAEAETAVVALQAEDGKDWWWPSEAERVQERF